MFGKQAIIGYMIVVSLTFAFVCTPTTSNDYALPVVWYISKIASLIAFYFSFVFLIFTFFTRHFQTDSLTLFLGLRCFTCLIPLLYIASSDSFLVHYLTVIITLFSYIIARNSRWRYERLISLVLISFAIILCIQVIMTFFKIPVPYLERSYKYYMRIPLAATNVIAAYLVPIFYLLIFNLHIKKIIKILLSIVFIASIILTKSRGGITCLLLTLLIYIVLFNNKFKVQYKFFLVVVLVLGGYILFQLPEIQLFLMGFSDEGADMNSLSSGRLDIYEAELHRFLKHPLFGNGMVFNVETSNTGAHNMIVELLVQSGLIGIILYFIPILIVFSHALKYRNVQGMMGWLLFITAVLMHGMVELNFFNYCTDIFFWSACGLIMSYTPKRFYFNCVKSV